MEIHLIYEVNFTVKTLNSMCTSLYKSQQAEDIRIAGLLYIAVIHYTNQSKTTELGTPTKSS